MKITIQNLGNKGNAQSSDPKKISESYSSLPPPRSLEGEHGYHPIPLSAMLHKRCAHTQEFSRPPHR
jgi:hypothetical protein